VKLEDGYSEEQKASILIYSLNSMSNTADLPFVSFVIPIYNASKYLKLCLESIGSLLPKHLP